MNILESIQIGFSCFEDVQMFKIDGLSRLKSLTIGSNSFTQKKNSWGNDKSKRRIVGEMMNRNHSTYWIVNH